MDITFWAILPARAADKLSDYIEHMAEFRRTNPYRKANKLGRVRVVQAASGKVHHSLGYGRKQFADYLSAIICSEWDHKDAEGLRRLALDLLEAYPKPKSGLVKPVGVNKEEWLRYYDIMTCRQLAYAIYDKRHRYFAINDPTAAAFDPSAIEYYGAF